MTNTKTQKQKLADGLNVRQLVITAIIALAVIFSVISLAAAEENQTNTTTSENSNESVNSWKIGWQQLKILLTFNQEKKIAGQLKLADMRLIQATKAAENNNTQGMQKALEAYDKIIQRMDDRMQKLESQNNENSTKQKLGGLFGLQTAIEAHQARIARLNDLLNSSNLTEQQISVIQAQIAQAENNTAHLIEIQNQVEDNLKTKLMAVGNYTEEQAQQIIDDLENSTKHQFKQDVKNLENEIKAQNQGNKGKGHKNNNSEPENNESSDFENESD